MSKAGEVYDVPRGAAYLTTLQIIYYTAYLVFYIALARVLSKTEVNQIGLLMAAQAAFVALVQLGLPSSATRFISGNVGKGNILSAGAVARTILRFSVGVGGLGLAVAVLLSFFAGPAYVGSAAGGTLLALTFTSGLLLDLILLYASYFIGVGSYVRALYQNGMYVPLSRGLGLFLAVLGYRVLGIVTGWVFGGLITLAFAVYLWHGRLPAHSSHPLRPLLAFSLPVFGATLAAFGQQYGGFEILNVVLGKVPANGVYYIIVSSVASLSILWIPLTQALYPALSASHARGETAAISDRLAVAFRLTNLAVLPLSASLAAIAPTAIEIVYGASYASQAGVFALLALTSIFTAQGAILITSLQAMGEAKEYLAITLISTTAGLVAVATTAQFLGTFAGALGGLILGVCTVVLARYRTELSAKTHTGNSLLTALLLASGVAIPLAIVDYLLIDLLSPLRRMPFLLAVFVVAFLAMSRAFRIFKSSDFTTLKDALPRRLRAPMSAVERLIVRKDDGRQEPG
jgi:O-antigen/teichoic acid export membrane protein